MVDLNKDEYVFLMIIQTRNVDKHNIDTNAVPFKSMADIKRAILNIIANNIKNYKNDIVYIHYDATGAVSAEDFGYARIEYKNGVSKTYSVVRRRIEEVK